MSAIDKASRIEEERAAREKEQREKIARLDPRFPFRIIPLDVRFFGVTVNPNLFTMPLEQL